MLVGLLGEVMCLLDFLKKLWACWTPWRSDVLVRLLGAIPDAGKLAACSRPIGSQIGDVTKWTNRRPEAQLADQSGSDYEKKEKKIKIRISDM